MVHAFFENLLVFLEAHPRFSQRASYNNKQNDRVG